jgi:hypothetical protein
LAYKKADKTADKTLDTAAIGNEVKDESETSHCETDHTASAHCANALHLSCNCCAKKCSRNPIQSRKKQFSCGLGTASQDNHAPYILFQLRKAMSMKQIVMSMMLSLLVAAPSFADTKPIGVATLATAVAQPSEKVVKGVTWRCEVKQCVAQKEYQGGASFIKQCRNVATEVGPLVSFHNGSRAATDSEISTCNQASKG